jgi:hypothetical protein
MDCPMLVLRLTNFEAKCSSGVMIKIYWHEFRSDRANHWVRN